ncbi:MAG: ComEC/Rec2 family competence protein [Treponema sp.]|jgi:competence protein ComEC|nr:ComEC/Rec2 family competence protein [Treponema sp.]
MVNQDRLFPLSSLTAGTVLSYYGVYLLSSCGFFPDSGLFSGAGRPFILAAVVLWSVLLVLSSPPVISQRPRRRFCVLGFTFAAGLVLGAVFAGRIPGPPGLGLPAGEVSALEGVLLEDPRKIAGGNGMGRLELRQAWTPGTTAIGGAGVRSSARGRVTVIFPGGRLEDLKEFGRKCVVYLEGGFIRPQPGEPDPGMFRAVGVHVISPAPPLERLRTGLRQSLVSLLSRPDNQSWGSLSLALLLGVRDNLDSDLARSYREAGVSHVLALSGMHLAVLSALIAFLFKPVLGSRWAALIGALFIVLYVFLVGSQPSLDRAVIMYLLGALAIVCSLTRNPVSLLNLAFIVQIIWQPEAGIAVSFVLSYLALWGILHLGVKIAGLFRGRIPPVLLQGLSASLGAFIATASVSAANFGALQPAGILTGLVIVPLTSLFMVLTIAYLVLVPFLPFLSQLLGLGLSLLYKTLNVLVGFSAGLPGIALNLNSSGTVKLSAWLWVPGLSILLAGLIVVFARRRARAAACIPALP